MIINDEEKHDILNTMTDYVVSTLNYNLDNLKFPPSLTLGDHMFNFMFYKGQDDLYIRFGKYTEVDEKVIVIARVGFEKTRDGFGTILVSKLIQIAQKYNYKKIQFEAPNSNCIAFANSLGFRVLTEQSVEKIQENIEYRNLIATHFKSKGSYVKAI